MNHKKLMNEILKNFDGLKSLLLNNQIHYVDLPFHQNFGDLLIMLGTLEFFTKNNIEIKTISSTLSFPFAKIKEDEAIVFHGGGNFGDIYSIHQKLREDVIEKFKKNKIIILPQTIYFESQENYNNCCKILNSHENLHIFVRDKNSYDLAKNMSSNVYLCPDMAHNLWRDSYFNKNNGKELYLFRKDVESNFLEKDNLNYIDWDDILKYRKYEIKAFNLIYKILLKINLDENFCNLISKTWIKVSERIFVDVKKEFSKYSVVTTDRLHGHILSCILNKNNNVIDNSYGKNSSYIDCWTIDSDLVKKESF